MCSLGKNIVKYRKLSGYNQKELAELLNISSTKLDYWEGDKVKPDIDFLKQISIILNVSADDLMNIPKPNSIWEEFNKNNLLFRFDDNNPEVLFNYLKELGFNIELEPVGGFWDDSEDDDGNPIELRIADTYECIIKRENFSAIFTEDEITEMQNSVKETIEGKFYKKVLEQQKRG